MLEVGMEWAEVKEEKKREKTHQTGFRVWGRAALECGWMSNLRRSVGWSCVSLSSVRGGGAERKQEAENRKNRKLNTVEKYRPIGCWWLLFHHD
nr:hypothetical protein CFP56_50726 [Quercus suber]